MFVCLFVADNFPLQKPNFTYISIQYHNKNKVAPWRH